MNGISSLLLVLQAMLVFSGSTSTKRINGENIIQPEEYSWIAQLRYERGTYEQCKGSVFSAWHVLTTAQCVTGKTVDTWGELIGVRLGNFTEGPHCRNSPSKCTSYEDLEVANGTEKYALDNDIALVPLSRKIQLEAVVNRVCLPFSIPQLTEFGYTLMINLKELTGKQVVVIPLLDRIECELQNGFMMCTGVFAANADNEISTCGDISGRARRSPLNRRKMLVKGIQSFVQGDNSISAHLRRVYTQARTIVHDRFSWIMGKFANCWEKVCAILRKVRTGFTNNSDVEHRLPTDCGYSPIYPRELIDGGYKIEPDEFSWLASLVYGSNQNTAFGYCSGSVISSRYVLTAARCIDHRQFGQVAGVRLGDFKRKREQQSSGTRQWDTLGRMLP